jgi:hypothetical protein
VRDSVLQVLGPGHCESKAAVEAHEIRLRIQDACAVADSGQGCHHQPAGGSGAARSRGYSDAADPGTPIGLGQDPQARERSRVLVGGEPQMCRAGLGVPAVELWIRAVLLDDEYVHPQP